MIRRMTWLLAPLAVLGLAASVWWFGGWNDARHWPIRWLEVEGDLERVTAAQVRAAAAEQARLGFFAVDMARTQEAIESLPWVASATVSRSWPDALHIDVREQRAVARWNNDALISAAGKRFEVAGTGGMQGLAHLHGPPGRMDEVVARWRAMAAVLNPRGIEIRRVELDPRGSWRIVLSNGPELLLGRESIAARLDRYLAVRGGLRDPETVETVDLRYPNGLAVTRTGADARPDPEKLADATDATTESPGAQTNHG